MTTGLRRGDLVRIRGLRWRVTACTDAIVHVQGHGAENRGVRAAFLPSVEDLQRVPRASTEIATPRRWRRAACRVLAEAQPAPWSLRTAASARIELLPFQLEPALAWTRGDGVRMLIADEVGLGKTVQAALLAAELLARSPGAHVLIVTPAGVREQWRDELRSRFEIEAAIVDTPSLARASSAVLTGANPWTTQPVSIASIDFVKRAEVARGLETVVWDLVVFDEAHALTGHSDRALVGNRLARRARTVVLLSATPHSGDPDAFDRLVALGDLQPHAPLVTFRRTRAAAGVDGSRRTTWMRITLTPAERRLHRALAGYVDAIWSARGRVDPGARLAALVLSRRACSSAASLGRSLGRRLQLLDRAPLPDLPQLTLPFADDQSADDEALATPGLADPSEERRQIETLVALSADAARHESKLGALRRLLRRTGEPAIVFTEYRDTLEHLAAHLGGHQPALLHGALGAGERLDVVRRFTHGDSRLLLATDAASEGLNLQRRCRLVVNLELPWSPVRLEQRIGRVDRLGQTRRVHAVQLVGRDTTEERLMGRLAARSAAAEATLATSAPRSLSATAVDEAARIDESRRLMRHAGDRAQTQPVVTARLRHRRPPTCVYRLLISDPAGELLWQPVVGVVAAARLDRRAGVRATLQAVQDAMAPWVGLALAEAVSRAADANRAAIRVAMQREHAIRSALRIGQARAAATPVQGGLFDGRSQRAAAARTLVLEELLACCDRELERLQRRASPVADGAELAFAALP